MPTRLERLLQSIDPSRTIDAVSADVDRAVNQFLPRGRGVIDDWNEYEGFLADFCRHIEGVVLRIGEAAPTDRDFYWARCSNILNKEFGPSGFRVGFEMVSSGKDGGLYRILKTISDALVERYSQNEISSRVTAYLEELSVDQILADADEYVRSYGHLLPEEFTAANAARLKVHFRNALIEHPKTILRLHRVGR